MFETGLVFYGVMVWDDGHDAQLAHGHHVGVDGGGVGMSAVRF